MKKMNLDMWIYLSATLLAVGVFLPLTTMAVIGDVSYNRIAELESYIVILFAVSAPVFIFIKQPKFVLASAAGVWITLLLPALKSLFKSSDTSTLGKLSAKASGAMQDFAADLFLNVFEFSWGGYLFLLGLIVFTVACVLRGMKKK